MVGENATYLCGLLNSRPVAFFFQKYYSGGGLGEGGFRYKKAFLNNLPIPACATEQQLPIVALVNRILKNKASKQSGDTTQLEKEIDRLVYRLYELTPKEIQIVENC